MRHHFQVLLTAFYLLSWSFPLKGQVADSTQVDIAAHPEYKVAPVEIADYIDMVDYTHIRSVLARGSAHSLEGALAIVPGLRMESRGYGGSRRATMRGSLLRSNFGVRGLKAYLDGLPLTGPDGNTPMELLDPGHLAFIELYLGPHCAEHGPGSGGTILANSSTCFMERARISFTAGANGYLRGHVAASRSPLEDPGWIASYTFQHTNGYRAQEANGKHHLHLGMTKDKSSCYVRMYKATLDFYRGYWQLPGGLTDSVAQADPRAALPYSVQAQAAVERDWLRATYHVVQHWRAKVHGNWGAYYQGTRKVNPYGTSPFFQGYKREWAHGAGASAKLGYDLGQVEITHLGECQVEPGRYREYENLQGSPGALRSDFMATSAAALLRTEANFSLAGWGFALNGSLNALAYDLRDRHLLDSIDQTVAWLRPAGMLSPQASLNARHDFSTKTLLRLRAASAYSPPGLWEIVHEDGTLNRGLRPERGWNFEATFQQRVKSSQKIRIRPYLFLLRDAILPYTDTLGRARYANAARSRQMGVEVEAGIFRLETARLLNQLRTSAAWQHYTFTAYQADGQDHAGRFLPGVPRWTLAMQLDQNLDLGRSRLSLQTDASAQGPTPLTTANDVAQQAYLLVNTRLTLDWVYRPDEDAPRMIGFHAGINNILDMRYSNYLNLNDARSRYWNPAPGRNFYIGIQGSI